jgi:predicted peptidase
MRKDRLTLLIAIFFLTSCATAQLPSATPEPTIAPTAQLPSATPEPTIAPTVQLPSATPEPTIAPTAYVPSYPIISADSLQPGQTPYAFLSSSGVEIRYLLYLPVNYDPAIEWPLIVFLHGSGQRGNNLEGLIGYTPVDYLEEPADFPFILISPQLAEGNWGSMADPTNELLDHIIASLAVDANRLYLTGWSIGGHGTWVYALKYPERFAAIVPISGGPTGGSISTMPDNLCTLKELPIWVIHGADDKVIPPGLDIEAVARLEACDANVLLTLYPDTGHDAVTPTYTNPAFYEWLLQHSK